MQIMLITITYSRRQVTVIYIFFLILLILHVYSKVKDQSVIFLALNKIFVEKHQIINQNREKRVILSTND